MGRECDPKEVASGTTKLAQSVSEDDAPLPAPMSRLSSEPVSKITQMQAAEAIAANRVKDEFLAMLGHELRNPLSTIRAALELLRLQGKSSRELDIIARQVGHLTVLVDELRDVSGIVGGKIELRKQPIELAAVIGRAVEMTDPFLQERAHQLELQLPAQGLLLEADLGRLAQIFANLLTNAAKYSDPGSRIVLAASRVGDKICAQVIDQGVGIARDMLERVFELFVQQPRTRDRSRGGLGLGLAIVRRLVEAHGGTIAVHSDGPGKGSRFTVELPTGERRAPSMTTTP